MMREARLLASPYQTARQMLSPSATQAGASTAGIAPGDDEALLDSIEHAAFAYFRQTVNPANGLVADTTRDHWP